MPALNAKAALIVADTTGLSGVHCDRVMGPRRLWTRFNRNEEEGLKCQLQDSNRGQCRRRIVTSTNSPKPLPATGSMPDDHATEASTNVFVVIDTTARGLASVGRGGQVMRANARLHVRQPRVLAKRPKRMED